MLAAYVYAGEVVAGYAQAHEVGVAAQVYAVELYVGVECARVVRTVELCEI